ncbi:MAG: 1,4-dihydroxy-2-naphthoate octaprenyltransferase [Candidatus Nitrosopelagicus sp.]|jgi:1,4-dihydroxy-2-naphthoate octaprenyltransferase|uniref:UbiA prenyltransferase (MenA) n=1 Tax=uncultured marine thaumarchaeote KM3_57_B01 TaxID=1456205 RepID=A0A075H868_9ARCH|nr:UbiA prenyltransferase (menA) [uncultured marine thaumarchaeote KM3_57_B01]GIT55216.1 MAG: 1,4-dihydroxy-2-naphthoate octaprenyltransferase [Candidatus Nitrosopelagicus sp.]|tara:strand:- start:379 stop:1263 length:885 start_codon:yes stop_codon:yes gene_type:complete
MLSVWLRAIRVKFLLASVIAVSLGLSLAWHSGHPIDILHAILTFAGVISLHASVDLLNDYWDFKRGIDTKTKRTKMSGGTGVLPEGLLTPKSVYIVGIAFLILGAIIGIYFVIIFGITIGLILGFAILSVIFYSTKIVNWGLAEVFVTIKGTLIIIGTYYIQSQSIDDFTILAGIVVGVLSSLVLFVTSIPDHDVDKEKGRRTLIIIFGKANAVKTFLIFPILAYGIIIYGVVSGLFPIYSLIVLLAKPFLIMAILHLKDLEKSENILLSSMTNTLYFSRIAGALFVISFLIGF